MDEDLRKQESTERGRAEYTFDLDSIVPANISDMRQEGNYLVIVTDNGITFRHRIPQGKMLNKHNNQWILEDMIVSESVQ